MNTKDKNRFKKRCEDNLAYLRNVVKTGEARGADAKEGNYRLVQDELNALALNNRKDDVVEAAGYMGEVLGRVVEVQEPPRDNGAAKSLQELKDASSVVQAIIGHVDVRLDNDQLKHQHQDNPIGTRIKGGGNRFNATCDAQWHIDTTLAHMAAWADGLRLVEGQKVFHGQATPVDGIHYEGFCLLAGAVKYVLFHCYPSDASPLKM